VAIFIKSCIILTPSSEREAMFNNVMSTKLYLIQAVYYSPSSPAFLQTGPEPQGEGSIHVNRMSRSWVTKFERRCKPTDKHLNRPVVYCRARTIIQSVTERCGQIFGTSSTYQNKKKCSHQHVSGNILSHSWKSTSIISAQNVLHEIQCTPRHVSSWTAASVQRCRCSCR
jgi:hypothetical protein